MEYQHWKKYESPERWTSYYTQIDEVLAFKPRSCLEIGVGNGIVGAVLQKQGIQVTSLDIDPDLRPTIVGTVENIPLPDQSVDVVLCAEVLEHLPFERLHACLAEIARVAQRGAVISLPHWGYTLRAIVDVPCLPSLRAVIKLPITIPHPVGGEHYWEIGKKEYPLQRIMVEMRKVFRIQKEWVLPWMPYHHFFVCQKKNATNI